MRCFVIILEKLYHSKIKIAILFYLGWNLNRILEQIFFAVALLKYSPIRQYWLRFVPRQSKNLLFQNSATRKGAIFRMIFGEAKHIRLAPMGDNEPKSIEKSSFRADSSFNALARVSSFEPKLPFGRSPWRFSSRFRAPCASKGPKNPTKTHSTLRLPQIISFFDRKKGFGMGVCTEL